jgi:hypothetical protein
MKDVSLPRMHLFASKHLLYLLLPFHQILFAETQVA